MRIYIVEDDAEIRELESYALTSSGFDTVCFAEGASFLQALKREKPALVLLDVMLPGMSGLDLLRLIRSQADTASLPVILVTAKSSELDTVRGLDMGADDYIAKPFGVMELRARIAAHLRREQREHSVRISFEHSSFNISAKQFFVNDAVVPFTKGEYEICEFLARNQRQVFSKEQILENVFGFDSESNDSTIITHIKNIRNKLQAFDYAPIKTVWGVGYKWEE